MITKYSATLQYCNEGLGECTAFYDCSNLTVFNDGGDHINVRFNVELETDACHYLEICCDPEDVSPDPTRGLKPLGHTSELTTVSSATKDPWTDYGSHETDQGTTHKSSHSGEHTTKKSVVFTESPTRVDSGEEEDEHQAKVTEAPTHSVASTKKPEHAENGSGENVS